MPAQSTRPWWQDVARWRTTLVALLALGAFAACVAVWPSWTLRYLHVLAWPVVAVLAIAAFGPALARRVPALTSLQLPGGLVATFEEQTMFEFESAYAELTSPEAWGDP